MVMITRTRSARTQLKEFPLFGIQLDDEMFLDRKVDVVPLRNRDNLARKLGNVEFQPFRNAFSALFFERFEVFLRSGFAARP